MNRDLYLLNISNLLPFSQHYNALLRLLTPCEADKITTKRNTQQVLHALASKLFQKYVLAETVEKGSLREIVIEHTQYNKPTYRLAEFNTTHDGDWILVSVGAKSGGPIGVDVTWRDKDSEFDGDLEFMEMCLTKSEAARMRSCRALAAVYWCIKEAFLKYVGTGLMNTDLREVEIVLPDGFEKRYAQSMTDHDAALGGEQQFSWLECGSVELRLTQMPQGALEVTLFILGHELVGSVCYSKGLNDPELSPSFGVHYVPVDAILAEAA
jgi:phosphopantetheinyl transferase